MDWYTIQNIGTIDSPALAVYPDRIAMNIASALALVKGPGYLRPHVKTNKLREVCAMMMDAGITKFKCATIAEAEMLAMTGAPDVLLAYQPVGPKVKRLLSLVQQYPGTRFSCLVDDLQAAHDLSGAFAAIHSRIGILIDINVGMNRSGIQPVKLVSFFNELKKLPALQFAGLHAYDGHIHDADAGVRQQKAGNILAAVFALSREIEAIIHQPVTIIAGGSVTFSIYRQQEIESSPGTFVFWDWSYRHLLPEEPFVYAALVITRVVSVVSDTLITTDLGHKSVAAENPLPRVYFLNAPEAIPVSHSEEHLVLQVPQGSAYKIGDVLYGVPVHICPSVALYEEAIVVEKNTAITSWKIIARDKKVNN